jgi:hypothetical protein
LQGLFTKTYPPITLIDFRAGTSIISEDLSELIGGASSGQKFGFDGGLDFEHWFNGNLVISTGVLYTQKGVDQNYASIPGQSLVSGDDNYSMNFIEVQVLVKIGFVMGEGVGEISVRDENAVEVRPFLCMGPSFGFLTSSSETTNGTIPPISNPASYLQTSSISLYSGGGFLFMKEEGPTVFIDLAYETGLTKVFTSNPPSRIFFTPVSQVTRTANENIITMGLLWKL